MNNQTENTIMDVLAETIDIPELTYDKAERRYKDLGEWLGRDDSACAPHDPHVFPQGSFRLGTVIRPLSGEDEYDLDLACELQKGIAKSTHSQEQLKNLVGVEVESYRNYRGIEDEKEEKHRCWRLLYKDDIKFHMDIVPCIPEEEQKCQNIRAAMTKQGSEELLAETVSALTVAITDNRHPHYRSLGGEWNISNPEGYARWFEFRMKLAQRFLEKRVLVAKAASVDELSTHRWKTPLQRCVQILKRHRDVMFVDHPEAKPISVIITTLAAKAYMGETNVDEAMRNILRNIDSLVLRQSPRIPNPVDPAEDFAERWTTREGLSMRLEENFWMWLDQAKTDFEIIKSSDNLQFITQQATEKFAASPGVSILKGALGVAVPSIMVKPKSHNIVNPAKPWMRYS